MMNSEKAIQLEGTIMNVLPGTMFRVALANEHLVLAHISGKMRKRFIRLTVGDRVEWKCPPTIPLKPGLFTDSEMARRYYFEPPRRKPKPKAGADLKSLLVRCPSTSKLTDTGRTDSTRTLGGCKNEASKIYLHSLWRCP